MPSSKCGMIEGTLPWRWTGHLCLEYAWGVKQSKRNSKWIFNKTLHVPENREFPSHWWAAKVVQSPQSSPYPPRSLSLKFYAEGQFLLRPWNDTSPSWGQGWPFDTALVRYQSFPSNHRMFCHKRRNRPWTPPWPSQSGQRISPSCTFEMMLEHYIVQMTFACMRKCHMDI